MPVEFKQHRMEEVALPFTVEDAFQAYATFANILDFSFDDLYADDTQAVDKTASAAGWYADLIVADADLLPASHVIAYHKTATRQGVAVGYTSDAHWLLTTDASGYPEVLKKTGAGSYITVQKIPKVAPAEADMLVAVRQIQMSDDDTDIWLSLSLWANGLLVTTYTEKIGAVIVDPQVGFAAYGGESVEYTAIRIPELTDFAEYGTLDPGEVAMGGLNRAIEGRYLRFRLRFNDALRAWKVKPVESVLDLPSTHMYNRSNSADLRNLKTRVRMVGAYVWAEARNESLIGRYQDRFEELNNPMLFSEEECFDEATNTLKRMEEAAFGQTFTAPHTALVEPEDRITTPDGDLIVNSIQLRFTPGSIEQTIDGRRYVWGEPD